MLEISDTAYRIAIDLDISSHDDEDGDLPTIILNVSYPAAYPDIAPDLDLSAPPNGPRHPLLDISKDKIRLLESLNSTIEESLGMAMIFTLVSTLKESAETLIAERQRQTQSVKDVEAARVEEEENRKFHGTAVTRQSFLKWREEFRTTEAEREKKEREDKELEERKKRGGKGDEKRLTGKQLWERGLVGKIEDEQSEGEDVDGIVASTTRLQIDP